MVWDKRRGGWERHIDVQCLSHFLTPKLKRSTSNYFHWLCAFIFTRQKAASTDNMVHKEGGAWFLIQKRMIFIPMSLKIYRTVLWSSGFLSPHIKRPNWSSNLHEFPCSFRLHVILSPGVLASRPNPKIFLVRYFHIEDRSIFHLMLRDSRFASVIYVFINSSWQRGLEASVQAVKSATLLAASQISQLRSQYHVSFLHNM